MTGPLDPQPWYQFDESQVDMIASAIDASAEVEGQSHVGLPGEVCARLEAQVVTDGLQRALAGVFFRTLRIDAADPARVQVGLYGDSSTAEDASSFLSPIGSALADEVALWRALADEVAHPLPKSLLHDLLFVRRDGDVGLHAREAIRLYFDVAQTSSVNLTTRVYSVLRALTLVRLTGSASHTGTVAQVLQDLIAIDLDGESAPKPGLTLPMVAALVDIAGTGAVASPVSELLESVLERFGTADHIDFIEAVFRLSPSVTDERKEEVRRARVTTRLERAKNEERAELKLFRLEEAATQARDLGYTELRDEAIAELQHVDTDSMEWVEIGAEAPFPTEIAAGYIGDFTNHGDWKRGLRQWLALDEPPSGKYADNEAVAKGALDQSVIQKLFPRFRVGTHGMPERRGTADRLLTDKVRDVEYSHALIEGALLCEALKQIGRLANEPSEQELSALLMERYCCPAANAAILAKALLLFWQSEYLVCAYFITPFIESGARTLLLELNEPIYRVEVGQSKGQYPPVGTLLTRLEAEGFDPDWIRYIETITVSDGQNYRNDIAHGFLRQMDPVVATLLLRAAALFLTMPLESATATEIKQLIQRPAPERPHRSLLRRIRQAISAARRELRRP
jgi:hypothetical protein